MDKKEGIDKPNQSIDVNADKVGVFGSGARIEKQDLSTNIIINNYREKQEEHKTQDSQKPEKITDNPYMGLAHFGPKDSDLFFGRDDIIEKLTTTISKNRFTAVIGSSGSGKSSVILAGVAPRLFSQGNWLFSYFRVSDSSVNDPFLAMSQALIPYFDASLNGIEQLREARKLAQYLYDGDVTLLDVCDRVRQNFPQKKLLLIADQFEELYTTGVTEEAQEKFISLLVTTLYNQEGNDDLRALSMVVTLRVDFLEQAAANAALATLIDSSAHIIGPMGREQLRLAIEEPAKLKGVQFEAGLVDTILDDVGKTHGNLPLVEFTLQLLWEKQQNKIISASAYHALGRVKGALSMHAQGIYQSLNKAEQKAAQRIFTQLVKLGSGTEDTRRIALKNDFSAADWSLLQRFANGSHRLVVTNKVDDIETAEVVHEALIGHWPLLRQWVKESRSFLIWLDDMRHAMQQWYKLEKDRDSLLRGVILGLAQEWLSKKPDNIPTNVLQFVQLSHNRQLETTKIAEEQRDKLLITQSRFLADLSRQHTEKGNARLGALLALEALPNYSKKELLRPYISKAEYSLYATVGMPMDAFWLQHEGEVYHAFFNPEGTRIVTVSNDNTERVWDSVSGQLLHTLKGHTKRVCHAAFSRDGTRIITASTDTSARIWDSVSGQTLHTLNGHTHKVLHADFSPDGTRIVTASVDNTARVWDSINGKSLHILAGHSSTVRYAAFSPDGTRVVTASIDTTARLWDSASGQELHTLKGHTDCIALAVFSPDGTRILTASTDGTARVWDSASGQTLHTLDGNTDYVEHAAFSPDGTRIVTVSGDNLARVWNSVSGQQLHTLKGHTKRVCDAAFSRDGTRIVTASEDKTARVWGSASGQTLHTLKGHTDWLVQAAFSPDGTRIVTASRDKTARVWVSVNIQALQTLKGHTDHIDHVAFSPDGTRIVTASGDNTARVWDSVSGQQLLTLEGHVYGVIQAVYNPDGTRIVTVSWDQTARVWDSVSGQELLILKGHTLLISYAAFSPDGTRIVTASADGTSRVWDSVSGKSLLILQGHSVEVRHAAFGPDGMRIVTASNDNTTQVWDSASGQELHILEGQTNSHKAFSPDGRRIVTASRDNTARVWDSVSGQQLQILKGHTSIISYAAFSPDGRRIVTASADNTARVWDSVSGQELHILKGQTDLVSHAAFSPDGTRILTVSFDYTVRVWDSTRGQELHSLKGHADIISHAAFSPDGTRIVTASADNTARVWRHFSTEELVALFKSLNLPALTEKERRQSYLD